MRYCIKKYFSKVSVLRCAMAFTVLLFYTACTKYDGVYDQVNNSIDKYDGTVQAFIEANSDNQFDSLLKVVNRLPQFKKELEQDSITFILPVNNCFATAFDNLNTIRKSEGKDPVYINTADVAQLDTIMDRYIINGVYRTQDIAPYNDGLMVFSVEHNIQMNLKYAVTNASGAVNTGPKVLQVSDTKEAPYTQYWTTSTTTAVNFMCTNGVVHTISTSHEFGFGEVYSRLNN
ncbi:MULTISPECIES: fasciclin domain-containing protein [Chitinophagaceae]